MPSRTLDQFPHRGLLARLSPHLSVPPLKCALAVFSPEVIWFMSCFLWVSGGIESVSLACLFTGPKVSKS